MQQWLVEEALMTRIAVEERRAEEDEFRRQAVAAAEKKVGDQLAAMRKAA